MRHHQKYECDANFFFRLLKTITVAIALAIAVAIVVVIIVVIMTLATRALNSRNKTHLYIQDVYVPSLVNATTTFNTSVFVDLKFERAAALAPHRYGGFQMTLSYGENQTKSFPVGTHVVQGFSVGWKRRVHKKVAVEAVRMPWPEASRTVSAGKKVAMVVELISSHHKWDEPALEGRVEVDASGHMVSKKPIEFEEWY